MALASATEYEHLMNDYEALWNGDLSKLDVVAESVDVSDPAHPEGNCTAAGNLKSSSSRSIRRSPTSS